MRFRSANLEFLFASSCLGGNREAKFLFYLPSLALLLLARASDLSSSSALRFGGARRRPVAEGGLPRGAGAGAMSSSSLSLLAMASFFTVVRALYGRGSFAGGRARRVSERAAL